VLIPGTSLVEFCAIVGALLAYSLSLVFLKVFRLLKNLFIHFVPVYWWVAVFGQHQDQIYLEFGFDVGALDPVGVFYFIIHDDFYG
jgi:hypothetical protein